MQLTDTPGQADRGSIIGAGRAVHLAWHDSRGGPLTIYYRGSWNAGESREPSWRRSADTPRCAGQPTWEAASLGRSRLAASAGARSCLSAPTAGVTWPETEGTTGAETMVGAGAAAASARSV